MVIEINCARYCFGKKLIIPRLELGTFCVLDRCDNHYTIQSDFTACYYSNIIVKKRAF
jgi:hypothetical protein